MDQGILDRVLSFFRLKGTVLDQTSNISSPSGWLASMLGSSRSATGIAVSADTAMRLATVRGCITILSESLASLPLQQIIKIGKRKDPDEDHPNYSLIHDQPNPRQTSLEWREQCMVDLLSTGACYNYLDLGLDGYARAIWPMPASRTTPMVAADRSLWFQYFGTPDDGFVAPNPIPAYRVFRVTGMTRDGIKGLSPIQAAVEPIGLALAFQHHASSMFGRGLTNGGWIKAPAKFGDAERERFFQYLEYMYSGLNNSGKPGLLDAGMDWLPNKVSPADAQLVELLKLTREDIACVFRVPLQMLGITENVKYNTAELLSTEFVTGGLRPWLVRWEQALERDLLSPRERGRRYFRFNVEALLRGDTLTRYRSYGVARQWGWISPEEIRDREDLPFVPGLDTYDRPANMVPVGTLSPSAPIQDQGGNDGN